MFEKEAEEYLKKDGTKAEQILSLMQGKIKVTIKQIPFILAAFQQTFQDGAEYGYKKALEEVKHDLMMKLKDDGIVKPLKDSIFRNERLSSQEQQELCAWIECAMDFGENLDKCAEQLTKAKDIIRDYKIVVEGDHTTVCSVPEENRCINVLKLNEQAEQFLNSEVEKKEND